MRSKMSEQPSVRRFGDGPWPGGGAHWGLPPPLGVGSLGAGTLRWAVRAEGWVVMVVRVSRRTRVEGGRGNKVTVRFTDLEFAVVSASVVSASAAAARLSVPAWLAVVGLTGTEDRVLDAASIRGVVIELFAVRRGMSNAGRNINDVARLLLGTGEVKRNAEVSVAEFRAATARLEALLEELAGYLPGVDLKHVDW